MSFPDIAILDALAQIGEALLLELEDSVAIKRLNIRMLHSALPFALVGTAPRGALVFLSSDY